MQRELYRLTEMNIDSVMLNKYINNLFLVYCTVTILWCHNFTADRISITTIFSFKVKEFICSCLSLVIVQQTVTSVKIVAMLSSSRTVML